MVVFDIISRKEILRQQLPFMGKIVQVFAQQTTPNCGLYIVNHHHFMYDFSWKKNMIIGSSKINVWQKELEMQTIIEWSETQGLSLSSKQKEQLAKASEKKLILKSSRKFKLRFISCPSKGYQWIFIQN